MVMMNTYLEKMVKDQNNNQIEFYNPSGTLWKGLSDKFEKNIKQHGVENVQTQDYYNSLFSDILDISSINKGISIWSYYNFLKLKDRHNIFEKTKALSAGHKDFDVATVVGRKAKEDDIIINWDYLISVDTIQTLVEQNERILYDDFKICEIGAGWGRVAYYLTQVNNKISYHIFDIAHILYISHEYIKENVSHTKVFDYDESKINLTNGVLREGISFYTPHFLENFKEKEFDLTINIASFQEMSLNQVSEYFKRINEKSKSLYTQQRYSDLDMNYSKYPKYNNWEKTLDKDVNFHPWWFEQYFKIKE